MLIQADKSVQDIVAGQCIIITTLVVRKVILHWAHWELLLETIDLVQEQNYRRLDEPSRVANRIEQGEGFLHTVHCLVFEQKLVVLRNGDKEEYGGDILEAMDPLLSLRTLSSNIKHAICKVTNDESSLRNSSGLDTGTKNILIVRHIVVLGDTLNVVKVAVRDRVRNRKQVSKYQTITYYRAESFNWYSLDRLKQSWTPASFHKAAIALPTSGGRL